MAGTAFVVTSGKGGVGKTTTALNLGIALRGRDKSVAIVDADLGMANLGRMLGIDREVTIHDVLAGAAPLEDAVLEEVPDFAVVTGDRDLGRYADADPENLPEIVDALREQYEYVILDAGAGLGYEDVLPIGVADEVILVTTPDPAALQDVSKLLEVSEVIDARVRGLVLNRATPSTDVEEIVDGVGVDPLGLIPEDPAIAESTAAGVPIERHDGASAGAEAYRGLAAVLTGDAKPSLSIPSDVSRTPVRESTTEEPSTADQEAEAESTTGDESTSPSGSEAASSSADAEPSTEDAGSEDGDGADSTSETSEREDAPTPEAESDDAAVDAPATGDGPSDSTEDGNDVEEAGTGAGSEDSRDNSESSGSAGSDDEADPDASEQADPSTEESATAESPDAGDEEGTGAGPDADAAATATSEDSAEAKPAESTASSEPTADAGGADDGNGGKADEAGGDEDGTSDDVERGGVFGWVDRLF